MGEAATTADYTRLIYEIPEPRIARIWLNRPEARNARDPRMLEELINAAFHAQGFENVQRAAFNAHHLAHTHYRLNQDGSFVDREFMAGSDRAASGRAALGRAAPGSGSSAQDSEEDGR